MDYKLMSICGCLIFREGPKMVGTSFHLDKPATVGFIEGSGILEKEEEESIVKDVPEKNILV